MLESEILNLKMTPLILLLDLKHNIRCLLLISLLDRTMALRATMDLKHSITGQWHRNLSSIQASISAIFSKLSKHWTQHEAAGDFISQTCGSPKKMNRELELDTWFILIAWNHLPSPRELIWELWIDSNRELEVWICWISWICFLIWELWIENWKGIYNNIRGKTKIW